MSCQCAVVASDTAGSRDLLGADVYGKLCAVGQPALMAAEIGLLLDDDAERRRLGQTAAARSRAYDWGRIADAYQSIYETSVREAAEASC